MILQHVTEAELNPTLIDGHIFSKTTAGIVHVTSLHILLNVACMTPSHCSVGG